MMIIHLSPRRPLPALEGETVTVERAGDAIVINGSGFDFSTLAEGDLIPAGTVPCDRMCGPVTRSGGHIVLTLRVDHGPSSEPIPQPDPIVDPPDGPITLPVLGGTADVDA